MIENKQESRNKDRLDIFYLNERQCRINFVLPSKMNKKNKYTKTEDRNLII